MRSRRVWVAAICIALAIALGIVYRYFDPAEVMWMPRCLWKVATGTDCPGCGSQRMAHALMHGDIAGAWHANAFALCLLPVILFLIWLEFSRNKHGKLYCQLHHPVVIVSFSVSVIAWWIIRNLLSI